MTARPLRDVFAELSAGGTAGDPGELLSAAGHPGLPGELVAEAVGSYADTAPPEIAEHLAPYLTGGDPDWPGLLTTVPAPAEAEEPAEEGFDFGAGAGAAPAGAGEETPELAEDVPMTWDEPGAAEEPPPDPHVTWDDDAGQAWAEPGDDDLLD
ncbi:hypothetical protein [Actinoplanes sp. RD1]|uniref:hypothetical protein n=1 Tax=Actinoplanes sp. RD1 TaxID=3064538 RepID=UPI0027419313|nr:hypothetical protein [Actinoplanes sp. RD1]